MAGNQQILLIQLKLLIPIRNKGLTSSGHPIMYTAELCLIMYSVTYAHYGPDTLLGSKSQVVIKKANLVLPS